MRVLGLLAALCGLAATTDMALAAAPSSFTEYANAALFEMPNRVTPDPMDLNAPLQCIDANGNGRDEIIGGGLLDSIWRVMEQDAGGQRFNVDRFRPPLLTAQIRDVRCSSTRRLGRARRSCMPRS
jgi:hypothetical protein